jgi:hypothetical protein
MIFWIKELGRAVPYGVYDLRPIPSRSVSPSTTTGPPSQHPLDA